MFCPNCGAELAKESRFCTYCGSAVNQQPQQPQQEQQEQQERPVNPPQQPQETLKMGWFKFLIYFGLFAGALINISTGMQLVTGLIYGEDADLVYRYFDGLQTLDVIVGLCLIAIAALGVYTRFQLSSYRAKGPKFLNYVYIGSAAINLIYLIGVYVVLPAEAAATLDSTSTITSIVVSVAMVFANTKYFAQRSHLFVN